MFYLILLGLLFTLDLLLADFDEEDEENIELNDFHIKNVDIEEDDLLYPFQFSSETCGIVSFLCAFVISLTLYDAY